MTVEQLWKQINKWGVLEIDLLKLDCEGAEYLILPESSRLGWLRGIGWIQVVHAYRPKRIGSQIDPTALDSEHFMTRQKTVELGFSCRRVLYRNCEKA